LVAAVRRRCAGYAGQLEAARFGQAAYVRTRQISSPTERISSMALLLRTTPGCIR
jgi:hypothetical protein